MRIPVTVEPEYQDALWCRQTLSGIEAACAQKKYALEQWALDDLLATPSTQAAVIVVGTSPSWVPDALRRLKARGIRAVLVSYLDADGAEAAATVTIAHRQAIEALYGSLRAWGRTPTALYGVNLNSSADRIKHRAFLRCGGAPADVFFNEGSLKACAASFLARAARYAGVIAANDIAAVSLLEQTRRAGVRVPEDLYAASFGGCEIARRSRPSLTTVSLNHPALGREAVAALCYLVRQSGGVRLSVLVPYEILPGESTQMRVPSVPDVPPQETATPPVDFYRDPDAELIFKLESLLCSADETDIRLLQGLTGGQSYETLAESCHVATGTVKYRLRRMLNAGTLADREQLRSLLARYLPDAFPT